MPILRWVLLVANAALFAWVAYLFIENPPVRGDTTGNALGFAFFACLGLNFIYLLAQGRQKSNWRVFRLISLWFDAKETELRRRADQNQK